MSPHGPASNILSGANMPLLYSSGTPSIFAQQIVPGTSKYGLLNCRSYSRGMLWKNAPNMTRGPPKMCRRHFWDSLQYCSKKRPQYHMRPLADCCQISRSWPKYCPQKCPQYRRRPGEYGSLGCGHGRKYCPEKRPQYGTRPPSDCSHSTKTPPI